MNQARLLGGRYQLGELLGYGGMAEVHRGRDERLGRDVAVKVLRADLARDPNFQARFRREAQNAAALNHPAIVAVYDTGEDETPEGTLPYIVMEYVEGQTLKEVMQDQGIMPQRALEIVADVCAALDFSHRHGIVHRDIKPGNVMLTKAGAVKVMDFGIARAVASATATMTQTSAVIGTAQYLSPEQARGETVDARSDVYSTGCLLYELLVGEPPFTGDNPVSVAYQHVREDPVPPSARNNEIATAMDAVVLKAMAKNPANRYQSAGEMRTDVLRAAAGRPVQAPAVMSSEERTQLLPRSAAGAAAVRNDRYDDYGDYDDPRDNKKSRKALMWLLLALALVGIFAAVAWATSQYLGSKPTEVTVPRVVGDTAAQARDRVLEAGLAVKTETVTSSEANKGKVVSQDPRGGTQVEKDTEVRLRVGGGPETVKVPDLEGLDRAEAESKLQDVGLVPDVEEVDSSAPEDTVVRFSPAAGDTVSKESTVKLEVSKGNLKKVSNYVGMHIDSALAQLEDDGFVEDIRERESATEAEGTVLDQNPKEGKEVAEGTRIILWVAKSPDVTSEPPPVTSEPPPTLIPGPGGGNDGGGSGSTEDATRRRQ